MGIEADNDTSEDVVIEDQDGEQQDAPEVDDQPEGEDGQDAAPATPEASTDADDGEVTVSIGDEPQPEDEHEKAPSWVKELRKSNREKDKRIRELEAKLTTPAAEKPMVLGAKPKLDEYDYDAEKYEEALASWFDRKRAVEAKAEQAKQAEQAQQRAWQERLDGYSKAKAELKVRDFEDAESVAQELFSVTQQGVMLQGADNPALVIYALGKSPAKAAELAKIQDPVKFAFAVAKLEKDLKVTSRKPAPPPERTIQSTSRVSGAVDSALDRLRAEAERTGNYTKVVQYRQQKRTSN